MENNELIKELINAKFDHLNDKFDDGIKLVLQEVKNIQVNQKPFNDLTKTHEGKFKRVVMKPATLIGWIGVFFVSIGLFAFFYGIMLIVGFQQIISILIRAK